MPECPPAVWEKRFDTQLLLEADSPANTQANVGAISNAPDVDHENAVYSLLLDGSPHFAPFSEDSPPKRVLHLPCGNGKWAAQIATKYPGANVIGVELNSPALGSEERSNIRIPNCRFVDKEFEQADAWGEEKFDFIYCRNAYLRSKNWNTLLDNIFAQLTPGGWVEIVESDPHLGCDDDTLRPSSATQRLYDQVRAYLKAGAKDAQSDLGPHLVGTLERVGFTNVETKASKSPHSPWTKDPHYAELGVHMLGLVRSPLLGKQLEYGLNLSHTESEVLAMDAMKETETGQVHTYSTIRFVIGQKPLA